MDRDSTQDDLFKDQDGIDNAFVSDELNGVNKDNKGAVRPRHARTFGDGLWRMIIQNGRSRVDLGVHWVFDAFAVDNNGQPDLTQNVGGVPLGLKIAEDIFDDGMTSIAGRAAGVSLHVDLKGGCRSCPGERGKQGREEDKVRSTCQTDHRER